MAQIARAARDPRRRGRVYALIKEELAVVKRSATTTRAARRSCAGEGEIDLESLIREEDMVISISHTGYVKRLALSAYRQQKRGGVGVMAAEAKDDDWIEHLLVASTHDYVLFLTTVGKVYRLKVHELPEAQRQARGRALVNLLPMREGEKVCTIIATRDFSEGEYLIQATRNGVVKKTRFREYDTPLRADGIIAINIREGDELVAARLTSGGDDILLVSRGGYAVRFDESEARPMGRCDQRCRRHAPAQGRRGHRGRGRPRRVRPARRHRQRVRQADARRGVPAQGPRHHGRADDPARRGPRQARRGDGRPRHPAGDADLAERDGDAHRRERDLAHGPQHPGRDRDAAA